MIKNIINLISHLDTLLTVLPIKDKYASKKVYLDNKMCLKITGNLDNADKILICLHGMGGNKEATYNISLTNKFMDSFNDACVIAPDMPGVGDSVFTEVIWGIQSDRADIFVDDIIDFILKNNKNKNRKIFAAGFSGAGGSLINYITDDGNCISNKNKDLINYYYLIMPAGPYFDSLKWIDENSIYNSWISLAHTITQINFIVKNKRFKNLLNINKNLFFRILESNTWINGYDEYKFNFNNKNVKNCDAIISVADPIINYEITHNFYKSLDNINIVKYYFSGHIGYIKKYEKYIINSIKKQC